MDRVESKQPRHVPHQLRCLWCTGRFTAKRIDALYCSTKCRTAAHRDRDNAVFLALKAAIDRAE